MLIAYPPSLLPGKSGFVAFLGNTQRNCLYLVLLLSPANGSDQMSLFAGRVAPTSCWDSDFFVIRRKLKWAAKALGIRRVFSPCKSKEEMLTSCVSVFACLGSGPHFLQSQGYREPMSQTTFYLKQLGRDRKKGWSELCEVTYDPDSHLPTACVCK